MNLELKDFGRNDAITRNPRDIQSVKVIISPDLLYFFFSGMVKTSASAVYILHISPQKPP